MTPLLGADGNVYAVAQGSLAVDGFQAQGQAASVTQGVPTVGRLLNGAIIEREIEFSLATLGHLRLPLRNADFTTAKRIAIAVNDYLGVPVAEPLDPSTVQLTLPQKFPQNLVAMLTEIEQLEVEPDEAAKIVIDERSGIIVIGRDVRVSTVAVAQGNLTVTISESPQVSQPQAFSTRPHRLRQAVRDRIVGRLLPAIETYFQFDAYPHAAQSAKIAAVTRYLAFARGNRLRRLRNELVSGNSACLISP